MNTRGRNAHPWSEKRIKQEIAKARAAAMKEVRGLVKLRTKGELADSDILAYAAGVAESLVVFLTSDSTPPEVKRVLATFVAATNRAVIAAIAGSRTRH